MPQTLLMRRAALPPGLLSTAISCIRSARPVTSSPVPRPPVATSQPRRQSPLAGHRTAPLQADAYATALPAAPRPTLLLRARAPAAPHLPLLLRAGARAAARPHPTHGLPAWLVAIPIPKSWSRKSLG
ncbi:hypothetical protein BS78_07G102200 [Paspalum vaginatum]|nr:hypothetical protein BS78_07G102200 [Paspalum vaginatum]